MSEHASWEFEEGAEIRPGRVALKPVGGGNRYEVWLVWDEGLFALGIAKLLRPDQAGDEKALRDLEREVEVLTSLAHPTLIRSFDAEFERPHPHVLIEHLEGPSLRRLIRRDGAIGLEQLLPLAARSTLRAMLRSISRGGTPMTMLSGLTSRCTIPSAAR